MTPTRFVFDEPLEVAGGGEIREIDIANMMMMEEGITRDDVICALLNGGVSQVSVPYEGEFVEAMCPRCQRRGVVPAEVVPDGAAQPMLIHCPTCRELVKN